MENIEEMSQKCSQPPDQKEHCIPDQEFMTDVYIFKKVSFMAKKKNDVVQKRCSQRVELGLLSGFYCCPNYRRWGQYGACSPGGGSKNQDLKAETIPRAKYPLQVYPFPFLKNRIVFDKILMFFIKFCFRFLPTYQPGTHYSLIL